jgi:hypothetical protein
MQIIDVQQRSVQWGKLHLGRPTASGFGNLMDTKFEPRDGEMPKTYLYKRLAEKLTGEMLPGFAGNWNTESGTILEEEARPFFELTYGLDVREVGFIIGDDGRCGCSPDGLIGDDAGLEIKCPLAETHLKYLDAGKVPNEYLAQVHGSLFVTGLKEWHFLSYYRGLEPLHVVVPREEAIMAKIAAALAGFYQKFDAALARLTKPNT